MPVRRALAAGLAALVAARLWHGQDYWNFSEGVYALTARLFADGGDLYGTIAAAQPPGVFLFGGAVLELHDSLGVLRTAVGLLQLAGGMIGAAAVWRLTGSRAATVAAPAVMLLTPWAWHENGALTPETVAIPVLLGSALLAARPRTAVAAGVLAGLAVGVKLSFLLPAAGIVVCAADRRRTGVAAAGTLAASVVAGLALFGGDLFRDVVTAQLQSGRQQTEALLKVAAQAGWSLAPLTTAALIWIKWPGQLIRDRALARAWLGLGAGLLGTVLTASKLGTALGILVLVEAGLVPLALAAVVRSRVARVAVAFALLQTVALVAFPDRTVTPFLYPGAERGAYGRVLSSAQVEAAARAARDCPDGIAYSGEPFVAYVAGRPMAGGQPDLFLVPHAPALERERRMVEADPERCP